MRTHGLSLSFCSILAVSALVGCSGAASKSPDVSESIRRSLDESHFNDVTVSQDRDKGVVKLGGHVKSADDKAQAESIAKTSAPGQVVADEIAVTPPGAEHDAKTVSADLDKGIDKNLDAALIQAHLSKGVKYDVKNGVVTLTGAVNSQSKRSKLESLASRVPNVQQVVNEIDVKDQKATSSN